MVLHEVLNLKRWYLTAAIAPALSVVYYLRSLMATYGRLQDQVPVHFGLHGEPNGWMSRKLWPVVSVVILLAMLALVFASRPGMWVPALIHWGVCGLIAAGFSEVNYSAAEERRFSFRPILLGALAVVGLGMVLAMALAGWWRG